ncbi:transposase [Streptomyces sp. NPDC006314]|uniref:transposase n=1 Tax=Streptomyces sp. NPDC006314 TaxID=3154475 RepID=UPI0033B24C06
MPVRDRIDPLMPADPVHGRRWADHRRTLEAIAWRYRTRWPWWDIPTNSARSQTAHKDACKQHKTVERSINRLEQWPRPGHTNRRARDRLPGRTPPRRRRHPDTMLTG